MAARRVQQLKVFDQNSLPAKPLEADESVNSGLDAAAAKRESDWYWRPVLTCTFLLVFFGVTISLYNNFKQWLDRPVTEVRLLGETKFIDKQKLANRLAQQIQQPILEMELAPLYQMVVEEPWVQGATLTKQWPPALEVQIHEQIPIARWGKKGVLNHQGDIFWPKQMELQADLPVLNGPATETQNLMARYQELSLVFQQASVRMAELSMEARGAWTLKLDNGIEVILGRENLKDRLQRFLHVYKNSLAAQADKIERVDIRYTNGAAVKWRAGSSFNDSGADKTSAQTKAG